MIDMTDLITPKSDQLNADDLMTGPRTFTISEVRLTGDNDQPLAVHLKEFPAGRPFKPGKSMRRVMVAAWGKDASEYTGKRMTLYRDPTIKFGRDETGGVRVSHMSHLKQKLKLALTVTKGKREPYIVEPLPAEAEPSPIVSEGTLQAVRDMFGRKGIAEAVQLAGVNKITGGSATGLETITEAEAEKVMAFLATRPDVQLSIPEGDGE